MTFFRNLCVSHEGKFTQKIAEMVEDFSHPFAVEVIKLEYLHVEHLEALIKISLENICEIWVWMSLHIGSLHES